MAAEVLKVDVEAFTDPFRLVGEGVLSFRTSRELPTEVLQAFEDRAGRWIATYRELGRRIGVTARIFGTKLELTPYSSYEEVQAAAEGLAAGWELGDVPADRLELAIAEHLGVLVLYVDAPAGISGAATYVPGLPTILVNRSESVGRRRFDLAHEVFHLLTWDAMRPKRLDPLEAPKAKGQRVEQLAENFAAALLMPSAVVLPLVAASDDMPLVAWIRDTAQALRVSAPALCWRLVALKLMSKTEADTTLAELKALKPTYGEAPPQAEVPRLFNAEFVRRTVDAIEHGRLSLRRAASLLGLRLADFADVVASYGLTLPHAGTTDATSA